MHITKGVKVVISLDHIIWFT